MNREIKFRALLEGEWYYSDSQEDAIKLGAKLGSSLMATFMNRFYGTSTLSQYTGLKDKNGKEIYEGDIIHVPYNFIGFVEVFFDNGAFNIHKYKLDSVIISGNIFQNPELKKQR